MSGCLPQTSQHILDQVVGIRAEGLRADYKAGQMARLAGQPFVKSVLICIGSISVGPCKCQANPIFFLQTPFAMVFFLHRGHPLVLSWEARPILSTGHSFLAGVPDAAAGDSPEAHSSLLIIDLWLNIHYRTNKWLRYSILQGKLTFPVDHTSKLHTRTLFFG